MTGTKRKRKRKKEGKPAQMFEERANSCSPIVVNVGPRDPTHLRCSAADFTPKLRLVVDARAGSEAASCTSPENSRHKAGAAAAASLRASRSETLLFRLTSRVPVTAGGRSRTLGRTGMMGWCVGQSVAVPSPRCVPPPLFEATLRGDHTLPRFFQSKTPLFENWQELSKS